MKKTISIIAVCIAVFVVLSSCFGEPSENDSLKASDSEVVTSQTEDAYESKSTQKVTTKTEAKTSKSETSATETTEEMVWIPQSGSKYHRKASCSNMKNPSHVTKSRAIAMGYEPCKRCY